MGGRGETGKLLISDSRQQADGHPLAVKFGARHGAAGDGLARRPGVHQLDPQGFLQNQLAMSLNGLRQSRRGLQVDANAVGDLVGRAAR